MHRSTAARRARRARMSFRHAYASALPKQPPTPMAWPENLRHVDVEVDVVVDLPGGGEERLECT